MKYTFRTFNSLEKGSDEIEVIVRATDESSAEYQVKSFVKGKYIRLIRIEQEIGD